MTSFIEPRPHHPDVALPSARVLRTRVHSLDLAGTVERIVMWAHERESRTVVFTNVHATVEADRDPVFRSAVHTADLSLADGWPVAQSLRRSGFPAQTRVSGPDVMVAVLAAAETAGLPVYFYGGRDDVLDELVRRVGVQHPDLIIAGAESPPFRALDDAEEAAAVERMRASGARIVFVGLGCPKQEAWLARQRGRLGAVALGVGAAFDFHAGRIARAPTWMQDAGLEWLHRLGQEPVRLARRYAFTNAWFVTRCAWLGLRGNGAATVQAPVTSSR